MTAYCPACLDVWVTPVRADPWKNAPPVLCLHVSCGRALEAIRTAPATFEDEQEPSRWAA
jgi:hypothetical protein